MLFGIVLSIVYSSSFKHSLFKHSANQSNDQTLKSSTFYYEDSNIIKPYIAKFKLYESPIGSVPVQLKLGKITFVKNPKLEDHINTDRETRILANELL